MTDANQPPLSEPLMIARTFNAPRQLVWDAITEVGQLAKWWGPAGMKMDIAKLDLVPGGTFHYSMQAGEGPLMWGKFVYQEILAPERIVFVNSFSDKAEGITRHPLAPGWPLEVLNTWSLTDEGSHTTLTLTGFPVNATPDELSTFNQWHGAVRQGFEFTFNQLEAFLESNH